MTLEERSRYCSYCMKLFDTAPLFAVHWDECPVRIRAGYIERTNNEEFK